MQKQIKICGLKTAPAVEACLSGGADMLGFIFFEKSPRYVGIAEAWDLRKQARDKARAVAVSVNADNVFFDEMVAKVGPDMLQLHGSENPARLVELKARYRLPLIKAFAIRSGDDLDKVADYEGLADWFLFDAKPPAGSDLPGGNGVGFDWSVLEGFKSPTPWLLSGGLGVDNASQAMAFPGARGIDVSSGVESAPGAKDIALIEAFLKKATDARKSGETAAVDVDRKLA